MKTKSEELYGWFTREKPAEYTELKVEDWTEGDIFLLNKGKFVYMYNSCQNYEPKKLNIFQKINLAFRLVFMYEK